jgi:hypothetical protein
LTKKGFIKIASGDKENDILSAISFGWGFFYRESKA